MSTTAGNTVEKESGDFAGEEFARAPFGFFQRAPSPIERRALDFVQHPTLENFKALKTAMEDAR